jgi:hypothetical protein
MYSNLAVIDGKGNLVEKGKRVYLGDVKGRNEAWLRDTLFQNPDLIPAEEIDSAFGPLLPLCKELRTDVGSIDAVFINESGRPTIIECKLWKNPQSRREVIAQTLDYVSAMRHWTYADFQRQVATAVGKPGNIPFDVVRTRGRNRVREQDFIDSVSRSLREGRFLVLLAGDGIREGLQSLTELVNRNSTTAFTFGLIEVAVYRFGKERLVIQPRVLARTELVTRQFTIVNVRGEAPAAVKEELEEDAQASRNASKQHLRKFWEPLLSMRFDDPEQEEPKFLPATNNLSLATPYPGIRIKAYATVDGKSTGVFLSCTRAEAWDAITNFIRRDKRYLTEKLPKGSVVYVKDDEAYLQIKNDVRMSDDRRRAWLKTTLNEFVNVLRPQLRKWYEESER